MKAVIKIGGTLLDSPERLHPLAAQLAKAAQSHELVVVHGGGKQVSRYLEERGVPTKFVNGLRVSDAKVIEAVVRVIAGEVNTTLVSALRSAQCNAVGLSGVDGGLTLTRPVSQELAFVGAPTRTDGTLFRLLVNAGYLPVVACIAADESGQIYNVNADAMAVSCAIGCSASGLLFLTDVAGVRNKEGQILPHLTRSEAAQLIQSGVAVAGMRAKLEAADLALAAGIFATVALGDQPDVVSAFLNQKYLGTVLVPTYQHVDA